MNSVNVPDEDEAVKRLKDALARRAEMDIVGFNYQQERSFDTLEAAAKNEGAGQSDMMGAGIGLGMGVRVGGAFGNSMSGITGSIQTGNETQCPKCQSRSSENARFCSSCGLDFYEAKKQEGTSSTKPDLQTEQKGNAIEASCVKCASEIQEGYKFCPSCGDQYNPCGSCGEDNEVGASNCRRCGNAFPEACSNCGHQVAAGMKFCPECGTSMVLECTSCQHTLMPSQKFCPECGSAQIRGK